MSLAMPNIKTSLNKIRENNWYITAFPFAFVVMNMLLFLEDLREIGQRNPQTFCGMSLPLLILMMKIVD